MKIEKRTKEIDYNVYITQDGKEFTNEKDAIDNEKIINGDRKICEMCNGKGSINGRYEKVTWDYGHRSSNMWKEDECPKCKGKGYFEKRWV